MKLFSELNTDTNYASQYIDILTDITISNKYTHWYICIIQNAISRGTIDSYTENHHILPKCFQRGGEKDKNNLVKLTGREHFLCHMLLVKMVSDKNLKLKLSCAALRMAFTNGVDRYKITALQYETVKKQMSENKTGSVGNKWTDSQKEKLKSRIPHNKGTPMSEEAKENLRNKRKLQKMLPRSPETKEKLRLAFLGKIRSEETKLKMKLNRKTTCKGTKWYNNGIQNKRSKTNLGDGWSLGKI